ncbi:MAG: DNA primase [Cyanobacteria bacterium]|nr:DNA primase [Cyanobacteriota bacterium]
MSVPRIHPDTVEEVRSRVDIVDVVSEHVVLKKQGRDLTGLCPFHDDKSPSFSVSPTKQFYYCFACGAGGNAFKFLMELNKRSFSEVVLDLARRYDVPVQTLEPEQRQEFQRQLTERDQLYEILAIAAKFYEHALRSPGGARALDYLKGARGLSEETIAQFQLGYAPGGWETLKGYLVEQKRYAIALVEQAGLVIERKGGGGHYDRFRDRLMIPIHDAQGRVIGFGGRTLSGEDPKYLNSPETPLFDKGKTLFGLDRAKAAISKGDGAIVVEGYFDVIALHGAGITQAVAALGTALSSHQVKLLSRYTESKRIILNFDADKAGDRATARAIGEVETLALAGDVQLRILNLPGGKDADEFLRSRSPDAYRKLIDQAPLWLDWQIDRAIAGRDLRQGDDFQNAIAALVQLLGKLPNPSLRSHYVRLCAERLADGDSHYALQLDRDLRSQVKGQRWHGQARKWQRKGDTTLREEAEADLLRIYLHLPDLRRTILAVLEERDLEFGLSHHRFLWRQVLYLESRYEARGGEGRSPEPLPNLPLELQSLPDVTREEWQPVAHLLNLDELGRLALLRPELQIRAAIATLETLICKQRCRHFTSTWLAHWLNYDLLRTEFERRLDGEAPQPLPTPDPNSKIIPLHGRRSRGGPATTGSLALDPDRAPEPLSLDALELAIDQAHRDLLEAQDMHHQERHYLHQLEQQRRTSFTDLIQHPPIPPDGFAETFGEGVREDLGKEWGAASAIGPDQPQGHPPDGSP